MSRSTPQVTAKLSSPWPWIALSVAIVAVSAVVLVLLLTKDESNRTQSTDFRDPIARVIDPVSSANFALSDDLDGLEPGDPPDPALGSVRAALRRTRQARDELHRLDLPFRAGGLRLDTDRALGIEVSYLVRVREALHSHGTTPGVLARGRQARVAWRIVAREIPGAGGRIGGFGAFVAWAQAVAVLRDGDAGPGANQPVLEDGDAGPGASQPDASADDVQGAPDAPAVQHCGGFEGVFDVVAEGISCQTAGDVAHGALTSKSAAGAQGFICTPGPNHEGSATRFTCDGPAGERASFSAYVP